MQSVFKDMCNDFRFSCVYIVSLYNKVFAICGICNACWFSYGAAFMQNLIPGEKMAQIPITPYTDI